jgi:hypothetical protein
MDDHECGGGGNGSSGEEEDTAGSDNGGAASDAGPCTADAEGVVAEMSPEDEALRRAQIDELLAIQSTSVNQYDDI